MSVIVKGVKMPESCYYCPVECEGDICDITKGGCTWDERPPHCPLVEIKPHGRLIEEPKAFDLDGLFYIEPHDFERIGEYFADQVKEQPTIIEAEDGT